MHISSVELIHVSMPLLEPWRTAYGEDAAVESVLIRIESDGLSAWGESCPLAAPCYSPEYAAGIFHVLRKWLAPAVVGHSIDSGEQLQQMLSHFKGNPFAKAALDNTWWVLEAKRRGLPLHRLLGAKRDSVPVGADFGVKDSIDELLPAVGEAIDQGFPRVKLKFRPGWDLDMLHAVRREFPDHPIHIDCNGGYSLDDLEMFRQIDAFNLTMIEQPLAHDDLIDHARLQEAIVTPICLDESITSLAKARKAIELKSCQVINIKPARVGGLTHAVAIHDLCQQHDITCWVGGMLESAVGVRICVALAMLDGFSYPADIFPSSRFYSQDLAKPPLELSTNTPGPPSVVAGPTPGTGAEPDEELLERWCIDRTTINVS